MPQRKGTQIRFSCIKKRTAKNNITCDRCYRCVLPGEDIHGCREECREHTLNTNWEPCRGASWSPCPLGQKLKMAMARGWNKQVAKEVKEILEGQTGCKKCKSSPGMLPNIQAKCDYDICQTCCGQIITKTPEKDAASKADRLKIEQLIKYLTRKIEDEHRELHRIEEMRNAHKRKIASDEARLKELQNNLRLHNGTDVPAIIAKLKNCYRRCKGIRFGGSRVDVPSTDPPCSICGVGGKADRRFCEDCGVCICRGKCTDDYYEITGRHEQDE